MNKINWYNYVDHIFCINYLPNNRYDSFSKKLSEIDKKEIVSKNSYLLFYKRMPNSMKKK